MCRSESSISKPTLCHHQYHKGYVIDRRGCPLVESASFSVPFRVRIMPFPQNEHLQQSNGTERSEGPFNSSMLIGHRAGQGDVMATNQHAAFGLLLCFSLLLRFCSDWPQLLTPPGNARGASVQIYRKTISSTVRATSSY